MITDTPYAFFVGDFNVGKSSLINALVRREALVTSRRETRAIPSYVSRGLSDEPFYAGWKGPDAPLEALSHEESLGTRLDHNPHGLRALSTRLPGVPFSRLTLVDTVGMSSEIKETVRLANMADVARGLLVVVTDIEYWSAKHTMDFVLYHRNLFGENLIVVANKADHLNANEILRLSEKASQRFESYGIKPAPRFFPVSARLEAARHNLPNEYRHRTKRDVRERCDAGMDALRVALYEFEVAQCVGAPPEARNLINAPLSQSFLHAFEGTAP